MGPSTLTSISYSLLLFPLINLILVNLTFITVVSTIPTPSPTLDQCTLTNTTVKPFYIGYVDNYCFSFFNFELTRYFADQFCLRLGGGLAYLSNPDYGQHSLQTLDFKPNYLGDKMSLSFWDHSDIIYCDHLVKNKYFKCIIGIPDESGPLDRKHVACQFKPIPRSIYLSTRSSSSHKQLILPVYPTTTTTTTTTTTRPTPTTSSTTSTSTTTTTTTTTTSAPPTQPSRAPTVTTPSPPSAPLVPTINEKERIVNEFQQWFTLLMIKVGFFLTIIIIFYILIKIKKNQRQHNHNNNLNLNRNHSLDLHLNHFK